MRLLSMAAAQQGQSVFLDADLKIYLASLTTPLSAGQINLLNTFVTDLKTGLGITNLSDVFDVMYILGNETEEAALKNLVKRTHDGILESASGSLLFTQFEGFTGGTDAQQQRVNTNYIPATDGDNISLNSAAYGVYGRVVSAAANTLIGVFSGTGRVTLLSSGAVTAIHDGTSTTVGRWPLGMNIISRAINTNYKHYKNKTEGTVNITSTILPTHDIWLLGINDNGAPLATNWGRGDQISFYFGGRALSQADVDVITDAFQAYMTANGKQV